MPADVVSHMQGATVPEFTSVQWKAQVERLDRTGAQTPMGAICGIATGMGHLAPFYSSPHWEPQKGRGYVATFDSSPYWGPLEGRDY